MRFVRGWELRSSGDLPTITLIQTAASVFTMETTWNLLIWCPRMEKRHGPGLLALNTCWQASVTRTAWQKDNGHEINILLIVSTYGLNPLIAMEARFCHWIKRYKLAYLRKFLRSFLKNLNSEKSQNCEIKIRNDLLLFFIQWRKRASIHSPPMWPASVCENCYVFSVGVDVSLHLVANGWDRPFQKQTKMETGIWALERFYSCSISSMWTFQSRKSEKCSRYIISCQHGLYVQRSDPNLKERKVKGETIKSPIISCFPSEQKKLSLDTVPVKSLTIWIYFKL